LEVDVLLNFYKVAAIVPKIKITDTIYNSKEIVRLVFEANKNNIQFAVFPELCITGSTCYDLFKQDSLIYSVEDSLSYIIKRTQDTKVVFVIGAPIAIYNKLINCAIVLQSGKIIGIVPKLNLSNTDERYFSKLSAIKNGNHKIFFLGQYIDFGDITFSFGDRRTFYLHVAFDTNISDHADINLNLSCMPSQIDKNHHTKLIITAKCIENTSSCVFSNAGFGESTTDFVYNGSAFICERNLILANAREYLLDSQVIFSDVDLDSLKNNKRNYQNYDAVKLYDLNQNTDVTRKFSRNPFLDDISNGNMFKHCCVYSSEQENNLLEEILFMQRNAIITRLNAIKADKLIIGVSGGVDSCIVLLLAVFVCDFINKTRKDIIAVTMPGFGTSENTFSNAEFLINSLEVTPRKISIKKICEQHFRDIEHDIKNTNVAFENAQARERTQILFDIANDFNGLVLGTGDMTEEALGFTTYNGDHISNYNPNSNLTKTIIRKLISYIITKKYFSREINICLNNILSTPISPELLPTNTNGTMSQRTENIMGPCELNDFFIYYILKFGYTKDKIVFMASNTFSEYSIERIKKQFDLFYRRLLTQQFKRSCANDGPQIFSIGFSPRGSFMMPSDISIDETDE
jgi:NAD+ synthase (glutamine-hydrolysing)